jgi:hypothetical protein
LQDDYEGVPRAAPNTLERRRPALWWGLNTISRPSRSSGVVDARRIERTWANFGAWIKSWRVPRG